MKENCDVYLKPMNDMREEIALFVPAGWSYIVVQPESKDLSIEALYSKYGAGVMSRSKRHLVHRMNHLRRWIDWKSYTREDGSIKIREATHQTTIIVPEPGCLEYRIVETDRHIKDLGDAWGRIIRPQDSYNPHPNPWKKFYFPS